jgi:hypothetical protein
MSPSLPIFSGTAPREAPKPNSTPFVVLFSLLFYLCSADQFFAFRVHGFNIRLGQFLLLACALLSLRGIFRNGPGLSRRRDLWRAGIPWIPFFAVYALAACLSPNPGQSFLKWGWALFNIGGALVVCLNPDRAPSLRKGVALGALAVALTLWVQFLAIYLFGATVLWRFPAASQSITAPWLGGFPLGFAQNTQDTFGGVPILRPNAFYYEPSYAGCALAFAFPLVLAWGWRRKFSGSVLVPAVLWTAVLLTLSRAGILGLSLGFLIIFSGVLLWREKQLFFSLLRPFLLGALVLGTALLSPSVQKYAGFLLGPLGPSAIASRVGNPQYSEGGRVADIRNGLNRWKEHPLLGAGAARASDPSTQGLGLVSENMWLEVGMESGLLGFLAFAFAILKTVWDAFRKSANPAISILVLSALAVHLLVDMNFTPTFPRLDYWILFFLSVSLLAEPRN